MLNSDLQTKAVEDLSLMIQCKTVSQRKHEKEKKGEFIKFQKLLEKKFPLLHRKYPPIKVGRNGIVFYIPGINNKEKKPENKVASVLMAHYDVVPADNEEWTLDPFSGNIDDKYIWGRGTLDTKSTLCASLEAIEEKFQYKWKPQQDLYFAFSGEEEIDGNSCPEIVNWIQKRKTEITFVLDEGGAIVEKSLPGQNKKCAMIGIAEKGSVSISCTINLAGGHASAPPKHTTAGYVSQAICAIEKKKFQAQFTEPVEKMFTSVAPHCSQPYKFLFSHSRFFSPVLKVLSPLLGAEFNALMHTTCAVTTLQASEAYNIIPPASSFGLNLRLLGSDTIDGTRAWLRRRFKKIDAQLAKKTGSKNSKVEISVLTGSNPSRVSSTECEQWKMLNSVITAQWPDVFVSPYLMMACSDSRHYGPISDKVFRFSAMSLSKEERGMIHGKNERIKKENLFSAIEFYLKLIEHL